MTLSNTEIVITFNDEDYHRDSDKFDTYCHYMKNFDDKIEDMLDDEDGLLEVFLESGMLKETPDGDPNYSMIAEYLADEEEWFNNFTLGGRKISRPFTVNVPTKLLLSPTNTGVDYPISSMKDLARITTIIINNLAKENFKPKTDDGDVAQLQFDKFFESYSNPMDGVNFYVNSATAHLNYNNYLVTNKFEIGIENMDNKNFQFVQFLDEFFPHILNALRLYCLMEIGGYEAKENSFRVTPSTEKSNFEVLSKKHNYTNLYRVYSKYLK